MSGDVRHVDVGAELFGSRPACGGGLRLGLGTGPLGGLFAPVTDAEAAGTLESAWQHGIRYFDTAPHYGAGLAEQRLGRFLAGRPRSEFAVSTKVGRLLTPAADPDTAGFHGAPALARVPDYSADGVLRSLEASLARTGLDRVDLVLIHDPDDHWAQAAGEAFPVLARLRDEEVVKAVGIGMNQTAMLCRFVAETDVDLVMVAGRHTLLDTSAADELLPRCAEQGVAVLAAGVFNSGVLADPRPGAHFDYEPADAATLRRAGRLEELCAAHGVPLAAAALQFPARHPAVTGVVVGARSSDEVAANISHAALDIPDAVWAALDAERSAR
ncbi:aldo/keto reductase [Actinacidiphila paucisporea]|uniref:D-threo-aldose 1-dehydrogenase n=1 Tax=Actinacidiphila paucisporea TaxID=310782 RepID=A0A1M7NMT9_9ACTN|nr:aldo/keto reductase [Actinacidiphila paucisporea]SHN04824.1 D-threo-aldose 1-dehydrogenase [Actinacidiphila paucisporea]